MFLAHAQKEGKTLTFFDRVKMGAGNLIKHRVSGHRWKKTLIKHCIFDETWFGDVSGEAPLDFGGQKPL